MGTPSLEAVVRTLPRPDRSRSFVMGSTFLQATIFKNDSLNGRDLGRDWDDRVVVTRPAIHTARIDDLAFSAFRFVLHAEPVTASTFHIEFLSMKK